MTLCDSLLRVTEAARLQASGYRPGPYVAILCIIMMPAELILEWSAKVVCGGRNKAALPRSLLQKIVEYHHESFLEISIEDSQAITMHINSLFWGAPSALLKATSGSRYPLHLTFSSD